MNSPIVQQHHGNADGHLEAPKKQKMTHPGHISPTHPLAKEYAAFDMDTDNEPLLLNAQSPSPADTAAHTVKRCPGRPHKHTMFDEPYDGGFTVSTVLEIQQEPMLVKGKTPCSNKFKSADPKIMGPVTLTSEMQWTDLLNEIAKAIYTTQENLMVMSFTWQWNTSSKATAKLPLTNEAAFIHWLSKSEQQKRLMQKSWWFLWLNPSQLSLTYWYGFHHTVM